MSQAKKENKKKPLAFLPRIRDVLAANKPEIVARLEAFLSAVPGEYCGFAKDGTVIYSENFCKFLKIDKLENIHDIQDSLSTGDAAVLEGMFIRLQEQNKSFTIDVSSEDGKQYFRISGTQGKSIDNNDEFDILWIEDITDTAGEQQRQKKEIEDLLAEIEKLQVLIDRCIPFPMWMRNRETEISWCNHQYAQMLETTPATVIAEQKEIPTTNKGSNPPLPELARKAFNTGRIQTCQRHVISGGERKLIKIYEIPKPHSDYTLGIAQDITREEELQKELDRYVKSSTELLEQLKTAIAIYGADHKLEFYNSSFVHAWDFEEKWLNSKPTLERILDKLREKRKLPEQADFRKYKQKWISMFTDLIEPYEDMLHLPDGTAFRMLVVPHPMGGLMMTFEDVTNRLNLESSLNTLMAVQRETLDNLAEAVVVFGSDGRLKLSNPSFMKLWNYTDEDIENTPHISELVDKTKQFFYKKDWEALRKKFISLGLERKANSGRLQCRNNRFIDYSTVPLPDGGVLVSYVDTTDSVRVETALREKNAALETAEQLKTDFLANVSYQLRTPLNTIMGFAEMLNNEYFGKLNKKQAEYTAGIKDAGDKLLTLINNILDITTIEAGYMELDKSEFDVCKTLTLIQEITTEWALKKKISVELDCDKSVGKLTADERRIKQIVLNLVRNSINFTPEKGKITIAAKRNEQEKTIELCVSDTGTGLSREEQKQAFQPFNSTDVINDGTKEKQKGKSYPVPQRGAGLGLSLVKKIAELHNGKVKMESKKGKGTAVTVTLPL